MSLSAPAAALVLLSACSGGTSNSGAPAQSAPQTPRTGQTKVTFTMHWTAPSAHAAGARAPAYLPATVRSVSVSVNGGVAQYLNAPSTTLTISAPAGVDTFSFVAYDEQNGQGNAISRASIKQTVMLDTANIVSATLNGVVASLAVSLGNGSPNAGVAATVPVNVSALDADGNVIVGPADFSSPIKLTISDLANSGTLALSSSLVQAPGRR